MCIKCMLYLELIKINIFYVIIHRNVALTVASVKLNVNYIHYSP